MFKSMFANHVSTVIGYNKSAILNDQSGSSRVDMLKKATLDKVKNSYPQSGYVKNETEKNSRFDALRRVRAGGSVVPVKVQERGMKTT